MEFNYWIAIGTALAVILFSAALCVAADAIIHLLNKIGDRLTNWARGLND